jgi:uncharacterized membrane protein YhaH (DUF805 family)
VLRSYARFSGRARRSEYWWWSVAHTVVGTAWLVLGSLLVVATGESEPVSIVVGLSYLVMLVGLLVPSIAVTVRRLHDVGRSGWWCLISLAPFGGIVLLVFTCMDSEPGPNAYGPWPKLPHRVTYA